jgi:hypothetical protein
VFAVDGSSGSVAVLGYVRAVNYEGTIGCSTGYQTTANINNPNLPGAFVLKMSDYHIPSSSWSTITTGNYVIPGGSDYEAVDLRMLVRSNRVTSGGALMTVGIDAARITQ